MNFTIESSNRGPCLVVCEPWTADHTRFAIENKVSSVFLSALRGWRGDNVDFLVDLSHQLKSLWVQNYYATQLEAINSLVNLEWLCLEWMPKGHVEFSSFSKLKTCSIEYIKGFCSVRDCISLEDLHIAKFNEKSLASLNQLTNLKRLEMDRFKCESLSGIEPMKNLRILEINQCRKLNDLSGIMHLDRLLWFTCSFSRGFTDLSPLAKLPRLTWVNFYNCGDIQSLKPLANCKYLRGVFFPGDTKILDGDLAVLKSLKHLERVAFRERKFYNCDRSDFPIGDSSPIDFYDESHLPPIA